MFNQKVLYDYAMRFVGLPYRWGGDDPMAGYDCSGLVIELLQSCGLLPHRYDNTAQGLYNHFVRKNAVSLTESEFGALLFYGTGLKKITHIGFGLDHYRMLEAGGGGSSTTSEDAAIARNAFVRIRPATYRKDIVAILKPHYHTPI